MHACMHACTHISIHCMQAFIHTTQYSHAHMHSYMHTCIHAYIHYIHDTYIKYITYIAHITYIIHITLVASRCVALHCIALHSIWHNQLSFRGRYLRGSLREEHAPPLQDVQSHLHCLFQAASMFAMVKRACLLGVCEYCVSSPCAFLDSHSEDCCSGNHGRAPHGRLGPCESPNELNCKATTTTPFPLSAPGPLSELDKLALRFIECEDRAMRNGFGCAEDTQMKAELALAYRFPCREKQFKAKRTCGKTCPVLRSTGCKLD